MKNFKLKTLALFLVLFALVLASCVNPGVETDTETEAPNTENPFDAAALVAGFEDKVATTVKLTYVTNYQVDVVRPGADASGMDSFKRDVVATAVIEMDLGEDLYIKVTKTRQDKLIDDTATVTEELLYKKDGKYYYQSSSASATEVADPAAKLAEIFEAATYEQIGGLTLDALLYNAIDKQYELKVFGLSDTFIEDDLVDPTYSAGENGGLKVNYKPEYIGYRTDGGWSDFSNAEDGYAAEVEIATNDKGFVTSMKETYNKASLVFNIMSNPPTVTITGERSFTASYGEEITKVEGVDFAPSVAVFTDATGGTYIVKTCAMGDFGNMADVANGGALEAGKILCVKPTAAEGYEIVKVVVNGVETPMVDPAAAGGFYCFTITPGDNTVEVFFKESAPTNGVVNVTNNTEFDYELQSFLYEGAPSNYQVITNGQIVPGASVFGAIVIDSANAVDVYVNGTATTVNIPSNGVTFYCFAVKQGGTFEVVINEKGGEAPAPDKTHGEVTITNNTDLDYELQSFVYANGAPSGYQTITDGKIEPGQSVFGAIVIAAGNDVVVTVNGVATVVNIPSGNIVYYCFSVKEAGDYEVVITGAGTNTPPVETDTETDTDVDTETDTETETGTADNDNNQPAPEETKATVTVTNPTNVAYELQSFVYANGAPSGYQTITDGKIVPGQAVFGAIVVASDVPVVVTVNGVATTVNIPAGPKTFYCFAVSAADEFDVVIKAIGNVTVTNNTEATYELQSFLYAGAPSNYQVITDGKIEAGQAVFGAIVVPNATPVVVTVNGVATTVNIPAGDKTFYCFAVSAAGNFEVVIDDIAPAKGIVTVTNESGVAYELQSFIYAGAPSNYQVITNGEIEPGQSVFGAIVVATETPVVVTVNGTATTVNIPSGANTFYCFAVSEAGEFDVVITPAS